MAKHMIRASTWTVYASLPLFAALFALGVINQVPGHDMNTWLWGALAVAMLCGIAGYVFLLSEFFTDAGSEQLK